VNEVLVLDTNADPTEPWPEPETTPVLQEPEFIGIRDILSEPPVINQLTTPIPNPPSITTAQMNADASSLGHYYRNADGSLDRAAAAAAIQTLYQIPPGPRGGIAPAYMDQYTYDSLKNLERQFLDRAESILSWDSNPANRPLPPEAFGVDPVRAQILSVEAGTVAAINAAGPWPAELMGTGE